MKKTRFAILVRRLTSSRGPVGDLKIGRLYRLRPLPVVTISCPRSVGARERPRDISSHGGPFLPLFPFVCFCFFVQKHIIIVFVPKDMIPPLHKLHEFDDSYSKPRPGSCLSCLFCCCRRA